MRTELATPPSKHARFITGVGQPDEPREPRPLTPGQRGWTRTWPRWDRWHTTKTPKAKALARRRAANKVARATRKAARR